MTPPELALVVPCYNEAARLDPEAFLHFVTTHPGIQLVMVDDGSLDGTWEILERIRAAAPAAVTTLRHSPNRGKAEAVRAGILAGLAQRARLVMLEQPRSPAAEPFRILRTNVEFANRPFGASTIMIVGAVAG